MAHDKLLNALYRSDIPPEQTERECDFIGSFLPPASHPRLLDLACETGRHSIELAARGYDVTGIDIDGRALEVAAMHARHRGVSPRFIEGDIRNLMGIEEKFDGILLFWRSFGFFDGIAQVGLFAGLRRLLNPGGRVILDLYNRLHFLHRQQSFGLTPEELIVELPGGGIAAPERSDLGYEDDLHFEERRSAELFDPHLYTPGEIAGIAANHALNLLAACSDFSPTVTATSEHPRMQLVFQG